jgi:hypothetical protein
MNTRISNLSLFFATAALAISSALSAATTSLELGVGYRQDSISWDVKERGALNPRSRINLHFKDLEIVLLDAKVKSTFGCSESYVRAEFDYGWVVDGKCREQFESERRHHNTAHFLHHRGYVEKGEYLDIVLHNDVKNGNSFVWDFDIAFAAPFDLWCNSGFKLAPAVGFALNSQQLRVKDRVSNCDISVPRCDRQNFNIDGHRSGNSKFRTQFWGPWVGFDFTFVSEDCWNLYGEFELHFGRARRHRDSNLGNDYFDNYTRTKYFWGPLLKVGANYIFCENWFLDASLQYSKYFSDANRDHFDWASGAIRLDLGYLF